MDELGHLLERDALLILSQVSSGLLYLHQLGIVHFDIKPDNILLPDKQSFNNLKICDFGECKIINKDGFVNAINFNKVTPAVDMWSLGVMLYYLCGGKQPFSGKNVCEKILCIA